MTNQFRVLHREFLFRVIDRELLSAYAQGGDASRLLVQFASILIFLSAAFCLPVESYTKPMPPEIRLFFGWTVQHFLIATTMLVVGLFAVLSWDSMFPDRRDVNVLAPLPIQARTVLLAKVAAVATALGLTVISLHLMAGVLWPLAFAWYATTSVLRLFVAYWITMIAAGTFVFGAVMGVQGLAAQVLPRRYFLRVSSLLQLVAFCLIVSVYLLQPMGITPRLIAALRQDPNSALAWSPSYWFFAVFQQLAGSTSASADLAPLATRAWVGLALALICTATAYALSYMRTFRRIAEEPDIVPGATGVSAIARWLSRLPLGSRLHTAVVQFSIRTLLRSTQHRMILAFYWGVGFAIAILFLKLPRPRHVDIPLQLPTIMILGLAVIGTRAVCSLPRDLRANWIFRVTPIDGGARCFSARRRAVIALSVVPACLVTAAFLLLVWPWQAALQHVLLLALLGLIFVEGTLYGAQKLPFTCAYLPGRSNVQAMFWICIVLLLNVANTFSQYELRAMRDPASFATMAGVLVGIWLCLRVINARLRGRGDAAQPQFEEEPPGQLVTLQVWDTRPS